MGGGSAEPNILLRIPGEVREALFTLSKDLTAAANRQGLNTSLEAVKGRDE